MNELPKELRNEICNYLKDIDSINLLTTHKNANPVRYVMKKYMPLNKYDEWRNKTRIELIIRKCIIEEYIDYQRLNLYKITHLIFGNNFNQRVDNLPDSITHIEFGWHFNQMVDNLPDSTIYLKFGVYFNQSVENLSKTLKDLTFGYFFNQPVNNLPNSITHLRFGWTFNQQIDNLPGSITHLKFEGIFNQSVDKLPNSINHLNFGWYFNQTVDNLPDSITHLEFGFNLHQYIENLPDSIVSLTFYLDFDSHVPRIKKLPKSIEIVSIKGIGIKSKDYSNIFKDYKIKCHEVSSNLIQFTIENIDAKGKGLSNG